MTDLTPSPPPPPDDDDFPPPFTPAPMQRVRHDGWTPERQVAFIRVLNVTGQIATACRTVGISRKSAYALRDRADAESFARAWDLALTSGRQRMLDQMMARAIRGTTTIMVRAGGVVEIGHGPDDRLMTGFRQAPRAGEDRFSGGTQPSKGDIR